MSQSIRIGSRLVPSDPFWVQVREGVRQYAQECGVALVNINLPLDTATGDKQVSLFEDLLAQELDALITPRLPETLARPMVEAGLPVIFSDEMEYTLPGAVCPCLLGSAAVLAAEFLLSQLQYRGQVLLVGGQQRTLATAQTRVDGFRSVLAPYPEIICVQIPVLWRYPEVYEQIMEEGDMWRAQLGGRPVDGIFGLSDSIAFAARDAGRALGFVDGRTKVVGINGDPLAIAAIVDGGMHGTVETSAYDLSRKLVDLACQLVRGEPTPLTFTYAMRLITRENAAQAAAKKLAEIAELPSRLVDVNRVHEQRRLLQMEASLEINRRVGSILESSVLLRELSGIISSRYEYDHVQFWLWNEGDNCLKLDDPVDAQTGEFCVPLASSGALGHALLRNQPVYIPDTLTSQRFPPDARWPGTRSRVVLPVRVGGKTLGVLDLQSRKRTLRSQIELDALQTLADQLGIALRNAQLYAQALEAKAEAEKANHLKSRLLANVSHELRTPLNIILGYSQAALAEPNPYGAPLPAELRHDLHHIERSGEHLGRLIDDLLNLSLAEIGALDVYPEPIDICNLLREVFAAMAGSIGRAAVEWRLQIPTSLPVLMADPVRLRQVLLNLLSNAAKFTHAGHIALGAVAGVDAMHIWVEDTGAGIPEAWQERVFASFVTLDEAGDGAPIVKGAGVGLSVAHHLVTLHGGSLVLESRAGHGTICHVHLPLRSAKGAVTPLSHGAIAGPDSLEKILHASLQHTSELTQTIAGYLTANYAGTITREGIADELRVSPNYVSRIFRKETGMSPWQFLSSYRIVQAQKLLLSTTHNVTEIASMVGFNDPAYFVRVFHKETGKAPRQYRKSAK